LFKNLLQMKIAYLSTFYPFRGGITHFNTSLFNAFSKEHEVKAFTFKRQYPNLLFPGKTQFVNEKDNVEKIDAKRILDSINPFSYFSTAKEIKKYKPDILIMKYWMPFFAPSLGYVAAMLKKQGTKVITVLDNVIPHEKKFYDISFSKYFLKRNSAFVVMSNTVKNDLLQLKPDAKYIFRSHPLYNHFGKIIDKKEARKKLNIPGNKKVLLFFGFVREYKGLDILIETMKYLSDEYYLLIAGEVYGKDEKYFTQIKNLRLENKISANLRYIADDEVSLFFSASDVNVLPYKSATQSGILSIAYHFELPVIVTDVGSLKEAVEPHNTGMVVDKADSKMIKDSVIEFFKNQQEFKAGIRKFKELNSWDKMAEAIKKFSKEI
ncbi:MAG: glycosyltransferase, partial [Bacteroidota bacterium]|nr:glycosyltransferase [Bacteroidota bacterium]